MTWLASELRYRVQILVGDQDENDTSGGFDRTYTLLNTVWMGIKGVTYSIRSGGEYTRYVQTEYTPTHEFKVRQSALSSMGVAFSSAFDSSFDTVEDIFSLKKDYFLLVEKGSSYKGRLFRIQKIKRADERNEYFKILAIELEERGTGITL